MPIPALYHSRGLPYKRPPAQQEPGHAAATASKRGFFRRLFAALNNRAEIETPIAEEFVRHFAPRCTQCGGPALPRSFKCGRDGTFCRQCIIGMCSRLGLPADAQFVAECSLLRNNQLEPHMMATWFWWIGSSHLPLGRVCKNRKALYMAGVGREANEAEIGFRELIVARSHPAITLDSLKEVLHPVSLLVGVCRIMSRSQTIGARRDAC